MMRDLLLSEASNMSDEAILEVIDFMQFLKRKNGASAEQAASGDPGNRVLRTPGLYHGQIRLSADFDAPLDDFREYM